MKSANLFLYILLCLFLVSCSDDGKKLADIESYIEDNPDSALVELRSMPEPARRCQKAKHALLHSMALDKCWVDLQTDSIIAPAVSWYSRLGRPDDRLKMYYYRARIAQNAGDEETAMQWLVKGERFVRRSRDNAALGRYYSFKSELYFNSYQYLAAECDIRTAYRYNKQFGISKGAITSLLDLANIRYVQYDFEGADEVLDSLSFLYPSIREKQYEGFQFKRYLAMRLDICYELALDPQPWLDTIHASIENYENYPMLEMAEAFNQRNMPDSARKYLDMYEEVYSDSEHNARFFFESSEQLAQSELFEEAYSSVRAYLNWQIKDFLKEVKSETRFIEERYLTQQKIYRSRVIHILEIAISLLLALAFLWVLSALRRHARINHDLKSRYAEIENEKAELENLLASQDFDEESRAMLDERLSVIENVLVRHARRGKPDDLAFLDEVIGGKSNLLSNLAMLFSINHGEFVSELKSFGLTNVEIGNCCLYAMGLNGKEINNLFGSNKPYRISSSIRAKLGLDSTDTNLSNHIRGLFETITKK